MRALLYILTTIFSFLIFKFCANAQITRPNSIYISGWDRFNSSSGLMSFPYPTGWTVTATERTPSRYVENYGIQPRGQSFNGYQGQIAIRVFDPMFVLEEIRVNAVGDGLDVFRKFSSLLQGQANLQINQCTYKATSFWCARETGGQFDNVYVGFRNNNGYVNIIAGAFNRNETEQYQYILYEIIMNTTAPGPKSSLSAPEYKMKQWYETLKKQDTANLRNITCSEGRSFLFITDMLGGILGPKGIQDDLVRASGTFDYTGLRFETIMSSSTRAAVRVTGSIIAPNGQMTPLHVASRSTGGSNVMFVTFEQGDWRVCGPVKGGYR